MNTDCVPVHVIVQKDENNNHDQTALETAVPEFD
jgi:hypothetical protein